MKLILSEQVLSPVRALHRLGELISGFGGIAGRMRRRALLAPDSRGRPSPQNQFHPTKSVFSTKSVSSHRAAAMLWA